MNSLFKPVFDNNSNKFSLTVYSLGYTASVKDLKEDMKALGVNVRRMYGFKDCIVIKFESEQDLNAYKLMGKIEKIDGHYGRYLPPYVDNFYYRFVR